MAHEPPYPFPSGVVPKPNGVVSVDGYWDQTLNIKGPQVIGPIKVKEIKKEHSHYFKDVEHLKTVDVYRVLELFAVNDPCLQHAIKKLLVAGGRGAGKDISQDIKEAIDSLVRWQEMRSEDAK